MAIHTTPSPFKLHWNYFLALERDMETAARYVEFVPDNFNTYSIELAHLLFAAASEVDVLCRKYCAEISPVSGEDRRNIGQFRTILKPKCPNIHTENVHVSRYGLILTPWENWGDANVNREWWEPPVKLTPEWWDAYNKVKHERGAHFQRATLKNALNALGALLIILFYYQRYTVCQKAFPLSDQDITRQFRPQSALFRLDNWYYHETMVGGGWD